MRSRIAKVAAIVAVLTISVAAFVFVAQGGPSTRVDATKSVDDLKSCRSPGTEDFQQNSRVRVFRVTDAIEREGPLGVVAYQPGNYVACDKSTGNWHIVYEGEWDGGPESATLVGSFLAAEIDFGCASCNYPLRAFVLVDAATGSTETLEETFGDGGNSFGVGGKLLTSDGILVYTVERGADEFAEPSPEPGRPFGRQVVKYDARSGMRTVLDDSDSIEPRSLKLDGSTAMWQNAGTTKSARIG